MVLVSLNRVDWEQLTVDIQLWDLVYNIYSAHVNVYMSILPSS